MYSSDTEKILFELKEEDQGLTREELNIKYRYDTLYWKDYAKQLEGQKTAYKNLWESHWNLDMGSTCYRTPPDDPNRHPEWDKVKVPESVNDIKRAVIDVSLMTMKPQYMSCTKLEQLQDHVKEVNEYYREYTGEDDDYMTLNCALSNALEMGVDIMIGLITDDIVNYKDKTYNSDYELEGWQTEIHDWCEPKEEKPSNVVPLKSDNSEVH